MGVNGSPASVTKYGAPGATCTQGSVREGSSREVGDTEAANPPLSSLNIKSDALRRADEAAIEVQPGTLTRARLFRAGGGFWWRIAARPTCPHSGLRVPGTMARAASFEPVPSPQWEF